MKKTVLFFALLAVVSMVLAAQSGGNEQRLVGSWTHVIYGDTIVFNADGTVAEVGDYTHWVAAGNKLYLYNSDDSETLEFTVSGDGRTLIVNDFGSPESGEAFRRD